MENVYVVENMGLVFTLMAAGFAMNVWGIILPVQTVAGYLTLMIKNMVMLGMVFVLSVHRIIEITKKSTFLVRVLFLYFKTNE